MMKVKLAGYNVNLDTLKKVKQGNTSSETLAALTPEVISAAYARISRSSKEIQELRKEAAANVAKARKSNKNIIFEMGHHSVAEHAYLNFDVSGLSRIAVEFLESFRLASFTEKSQRYVTFNGDYVIPEEFGEVEINLFKQLVAEQNSFYQKAFPLLTERQKKVNLDKDGKTQENLAKEDARYGISLATQAQLGFSVNARELEYIIRRSKYHQLAEVRELGEKLYEEANQVVPSLIYHAGSKADDTFLRESGKDITAIVNSFFEDRTAEDVNIKESPHCILLKNSIGTDELITASLVSGNAAASFVSTEKLVRGLDNSLKKELIQSCLQHLTKYDSLPREFEMADFTFELIVSATCYAQLKRHRMATLLPHDYNPILGFVMPKSISEVGLGKELQNVIHASDTLYDIIRAEHHENPQLADYCLTNAHRRRVIVKMNLRELYHFSRMREDEHAQWEIRGLANEMCTAVKKVAPITGMLLGGKHEFEEVRRKAYE